MKGKFDIYLFWPFKENLISWLVTCVNADDFTVDVNKYWISYFIFDGKWKVSQYYSCDKIFVLHMIYV